jgi:elongation factor P
MLSYTDLKPGTCIILNDQPHVVLEFSFSKKQRQQATVQTKLKNIATGQVIGKAFHQGDKIEEANLDSKDVKFLYSHRDEFWFCEPDNPGERFKLDQSLLGSNVDFLKPNSIVSAQLFKDEIIGVKMPIKVDLKVVETPPGVKGNTAQGGTKQAKLETGVFVAVPLFINEGDIIKVNIEKGEYVERVSKAK